MVTKTSESKDLSQALQTVKWLDQERRKDKTTIAKLEEQLKEQGQRMAREADRVQELQESLARVESVLSKVDGFEQMVSNYKKEMTFQLEQRAETRRKEQTEAQRLRRLEHEAMKEHLNRLEKQLRVLSQHDEQLDARQAEQERMSRNIQAVEAMVTDLDKRVEDSMNTVSYLEERRRSDHRRLIEVEKDTPEVHGRMDGLTQKLSLIEQSSQKLQTRLDAAFEAMKAFDKQIEELRVSDFQRDQKVQAYLGQAEEVAEELERVREQTHGFIERRQQVRQALSALETFRTRIERRQDEMAERQRLAEERIERAWEEWQTERAKELKKREIVVEQRWQKQGETDAEQQRRLDALEQIADLYREQLSALWEAQRADASSLLSAAQDVYEKMVAPTDERLATLRGD